MNKEKFEVKFIVEKSFDIEATSESEAKEKARELLKNTTIEINEITKTDIFNITKYNEMMKNVRDIVVDYMDKHSEGLAESHIEAWADRYRGKSKSDVDYDLNVNYDICSESDTVQELLRSDLEDENFELNDSEIEYVQDRFIEAVLENF